MPLQVTTPATAGASIPLTDVKNHLRLEAAYTDEDDYLDLLRKGVEKFVQNKFNRQFVQATFKLTLTKFKREIKLRSPVSSITSVKHYDADGNLLTVDSSNYTLAQYETGQDRLIFNDDYTLPDTDERRYPVEIVFVAGYGANDTDVPEDIKIRMLHAIGTLYVYREELTVQNVNDISKALNRITETKRLFFFN